MNDEEITFKLLDELSLDTDNPRLPEALNRLQQSIIDHIATTTSIEDLMGAIGENGFFPGEPLVVVPDGNKFVVVEGNRRLTAVLLLRDPLICSEPTARMREIAASAKHKPDKLPVVVKQTRREVLPYLGFRHITGVKQWEPLAKARYIKQLFDLSAAGLPAETRYYEVGRSIGTRRDHIKRNLDALAVYRLIESHGFYDISGLNETSVKFAVLSTAIADERIAAFVGVGEKRPARNGDGEWEIVPTHPILNPRRLKPDGIKELTEWLYKANEKGEKKVGESRNLRELSMVVDNPRALEAIRGGSTLAYAYRLTKGVNEDLRELLYQAEEILARAAGFIAHVDYDPDAYEVAKNLRDTIKLIGETLKKKKTDDDDF